MPHLPFGQGGQGGMLCPFDQRKKRGRKKKERKKGGREKKKKKKKGRGEKGKKKEKREGRKKKKKRKKGCAIVQPTNVGGHRNFQEKYRK